MHSIGQYFVSYGFFIVIGPPLDIPRHDLTGQGPPSGLGQDSMRIMPHFSVFVPPKPQHNDTQWLPSIAAGFHHKIYACGLD